MCECSCEKNNETTLTASGKEPLVPGICVIEDIRTDTSDVKTFRVVSPGGGLPFEFLPGQCAMLSVPGVGEAMFSITSSPLEKKFMEFSIKKCGTLTDWLHESEPGQQICIRGPYGNGFPVDDDLKNKNLLFIAGGIGIAPLRSVINYCLGKRESYGKIDIVYGSKSPGDLVNIRELNDIWPFETETRVHMTVDKKVSGWDKNVGFVPDYVRQLKFFPDKTVLLCGPPVMIKFTLAALEELGFEKNRIFTTMELKMKCGIGKCGRCNIGSKYVCRDGPVFRFDELDQLPDEY